MFARDGILGYIKLGTESERRMLNNLHTEPVVGIVVFYKAVVEQ